MQVILLATGETDRLRPLTETITAPMIPVANRPLMVYPIEMLARQGYKQMLASLYHLGGSIEAYFGSGQRWGVEIEYVLQKDA
ncbi:MAG: sugar phosphate nucleotidyltransferase, partial [Anaerolineae bacterium]